VSSTPPSSAGRVQGPVACGLSRSLVCLLDWVVHRLLHSAPLPDRCCWSHVNGTCILLDCGVLEKLLPATSRLRWARAWMAGWADPGLCNGA
jgi:hypothetical protein